MVRSRHEVETVLALWSQGLNRCEIARETGIPWSTVRWWVNGRVPSVALRENVCARCGHALHDPETLLAAAYAYVLGIYLGDGHISEFPRSLKLVITLDARYPGIVARAQANIARVLPDNAVNARPKHGAEATLVECYSRQWACLLPQHGPGRKHERPIVLEPWQRAITTAHPEEFVRGLIESDGCRYVNRIVSPTGRKYAYPSYCFTNHSTDIQGLFCEHLDLLGIGWRQQTWKTIAVTRRADVARLDEFVGPKR